MRTSSIGVGGRVAAAIGLVLIAIIPLHAQRLIDIRQEAFAGGEVENYLRLMQLSGVAPDLPWAVRAFAPATVESAFGADHSHPWARRLRLSPDSSSQLRAGWIRPRIDAVFNSTFPYGGNDGPVWAGRGVTAAVQVGGWVRYGPLSLVTAPIAFGAQNAEFDLATPEATDDPFSDPRYPNAIDLPQRFGDGVYARFDPGQSTLRLDLRAVTAGISTANQVWGPAQWYPLVLGNNAPGYPHLFLGTGSPLNVGIGRVHAKLVWGRLDQSAHSPARGGETRRFTSGIVGAFSPRWLRGLEVGATRFFHTPWPTQGFSVDHFLKPFEGVLKVGLVGDGLEGGSDQDNQLASVFARWALSPVGFEVYGEFAREDHNYDLRDFLLEPDHNSAYMLGLSRAWMGAPDRWIVLRAEVVNAEMSHLFRVRQQSPFYVHTWTAQGHTARGQILGSPAAYGGSGTRVQVDAYVPRGRFSAGWSRTVQDRGGSYWQTGVTEREAVDVVHALDVEALVFRGPLEIRAGLGGAWELNRYLAGDAFNVNAQIGLQWSP